MADRKGTGNLYLKITGVIYLMSALIGVVIPDPYIQLLSVEASTGGRLWGRAFGAVAAGFAVILFTLDPHDSHQRKIGLIGAVIAYTLTGLTDIVSVIQGDLPPYGWGFVAFNALMTGLGIYYLNRPANEPDR